MFNDNNQHHPEELDLYTDEQLLNALVPRYDHALFVGLQPHTHHNGEHDIALSHWGDDHTTIGIATDAIIRIQKEIDSIP